MIVTLADPVQFIEKSKPITYIEAFVKLYNWKNRGQIYEIYGIIELKKICALMAKHPCNLGTHCIIKISSNCVVHILFLKIRRGLCFMSITILTGINITNYMPLID